MWYLDPPECFLCALESRYSEMRRFGVRDPEKYIEMMRVISELTPKGRTGLFIGSFDYLTRILGEDPHLAEKEELENAAHSLVDKIEEALGEDIIKYFEVAAAANSVDVPMRGYDFSIEDLVNKLMEKPQWVGIDQDELVRMIMDAENIGYVVDNSGEFQLDLLLIKKLVNLGIGVTIYARGKPYEVDVTRDYVARSLGDLKVNLVSTGDRYPVFYTRSLHNSLARHSFIVSKGVGNLEAYLEMKLDLNTVFLLRAKCRPITRLLGVPMGTPVILSSRRLG